MHLIWCTFCVLLPSVSFLGDETSSNYISSDASSTLKVSPPGSLFISKVEASMQGSYTCEASNGFGKALFKTITVSVRGKLIK